MPEKIILGIDPGFSITGYSVLHKDSNTVRLLDHGCLKLPTKKHLAERVGIFYEHLAEKIKLFKVGTIALETPFLGKNVQSFLKLGYLRGVLYLLANQHNLALQEFAPREVKQAVTGYGGASKDQVALMVMRMFPKIGTLGKLEKQDVTDAIAVSLTGLWSHQNHLS